MARQILFVQGAGKGVHDCWDNKLVASLEQELGDGYAVRYPRMPGEDEPGYEAWKAALAEEFNRLKDGAILVGHSVGGTILIHMLAEQLPKFSIGGLFLVAAPFTGEGGWPSDEMEARTDFGERLPKGLPVHLYHGADDAEVPVGHVDLYAKTLPHAVVRMIEGADHQLNENMSPVARDIRADASVKEDEP